MNSRRKMVGNAGFFKLDFTLTPHETLSTRISTSRYYGLNNVFLDPSSPLTTNAISENGQEQVATETASVSLTSTFSWRLISHLRAQFSRDLQQSSTNTTDPLTKVAAPSTASDVRTFCPARLANIACTWPRPSAWKASGIPGSLAATPCSPGSITISQRSLAESTSSIPSR